MNLCIVIPAYNEEENIKKLVKEWHEVTTKIENSTLYIIDDGSKDNTYSILKKMVESGDYPNLAATTKPNSGHGATCLYGYRNAIEKGAEYIFQTDSDRQTLPDEFYPFWEERQQYAMIIGDRQNRKDGKPRRLVSKSISLLLRVIFGVKVPDPNTPFRLMKAGVLKKYLPLIPEHYNLPNILLSAFFSYYDEGVCWHPITFVKRQGGVNSLDFKKIFRIGIVAMTDFLRIRRKMI